MRQSFKMANMGSISAKSQTSSRFPQTHRRAFSMASGIATKAGVIYFDLGCPIDLSVPHYFWNPHDTEEEVKKSPAAFGLPPCRRSPQKVGNYVLSKVPPHTALVNVDTLTMCVHGTGTHTECIAHVTAERLLSFGDPLSEVILPFYGATLINVSPRLLGDTEDTYKGGKQDDLVLDKQSIVQAVEKCHKHLCLDERLFFSEAFVIRSNYRVPFLRYTGMNQPYLTKEAITFLGILKETVHLIIDLPTVDREVSEELVVHNTFFGVGTANEPQRYITEFAAGGPSEIPDGLYLLNLQTPSFSNVDAVPSKPILFPKSDAASTFDEVKL